MLSSGESAGSASADSQDDQPKSDVRQEDIRWSGDEEDSGASLVLGALGHGSVTPTVPYQPPSPEAPSPTVAYVPGKEFQPQETQPFKPEAEHLDHPNVAETLQYTPPQPVDAPQPLDTSPAETAIDRDRSDNSVLNSLEAVSETISAGPESAAPVVSSLQPPRQLEIELNARLAEVPEISSSLRQLTEDIRELLAKNGTVSVAIATPQPSSEVGALVYTVAKMLSEQSDDQLLMVDGSIFSAMLSRRLQARECSGVCDFLSLGSLNPNWIIQLSSPKLHFLPAGNADKLGGEAPGLFPELVNTLKTEYPILLIDAGSEFDGVYSTWATSADSIYLAVQLGATEVEVGRSVAEQIQRTGAKFSGTIICR